MKRLTADDGTMTAEPTANEWACLIKARGICSELGYIEGASATTTDRGDSAVDVEAKLIDIIATRPT